MKKLKLENGVEIRFKGITNAGATSIWNGCEAVPIVKDGKTLQGGDLEIGKEYRVNVITGELEG